MHKPVPGAAGPAAGDLAAAARRLVPDLPGDVVLTLTWLFLAAQSDFLVACYLGYLNEVSSKLGGSDETPR